MAVDLCECTHKSITNHSMIDLFCSWCNNTFQTDEHSNGNYPSYCSTAHYLKAYNSGKRDARATFQIPLDVTKLAYLAGLIDSDGHISVTKSQPSQRTKAKSVMYYVLVGVTNTNPKMLEWIVSNFGGTYSKRMGHNQIKLYEERNWKDRYEWRVTGRKALLLLEAVEPYLVVKQDRAKIALRFRQHESAIHALYGGKMGKLPDWIVEDREQIRQEIMLLNKKGRN